jgi:hypothetical protein
MKTNFLPNKLPFLPGNTYADPTITRYHKTQLLGIKDGTITGMVFKFNLIQIQICNSFLIYRENCKFIRKH